MAWIESHTVLIRHRKLREFARELGIEPVQAMGHLHALWHAALEQQEDGDLSTWSDEFIAEQACYRGDPATFAAAMVKHRWMEPSRLLHDWIDYAGYWLTRKYSTSNRDLLIRVWEKYGRNYSERRASRKRAESEQKASLPNQPTNQHNLPTNDGGELRMSEKAMRAAEELKRLRRQQ